MKQFYVMNLDTRRIIIMAGLLCSLLGMAIYAGMRIGKKNDPPLGLAPHNISSADLTIREQAGVKPSIAEISPKADILPPLVKIPEAKADNSEKIISEKMTELKVAEKSEDNINLQVQDDPMIAGPQASNSKEKAQKYSEPKAKRGEYYTIQVAAYKHKKDAETTLRKISAQGIKGRIEKGKSLWFLRVGKTKTKTKLSASLKRLKELNLEPIVRKLVLAKATKTDGD